MNLSRGILLLVLLHLAGCRTVSRLDIEPSQHPSTPIDLDYIERAALLEQWSNIKQHLIKVDGDALPESQKSLALFWMGMAQHHLGHASAAETSWNRAMGFQPSPPLKQRILRAQKALRSYTPQSPGHGPKTSSTGAWALQYGVFSLRKSAEDLAKELSWKGLNLHISPSEGSRGLLWIVWSGPYSGSEVRLKQERLQERNIASIVKTSEQLTP